MDVKAIIFLAPISVFDERLEADLGVNRFVGPTDPLPQQMRHPRAEARARRHVKAIHPHVWRP